MKKIIVIGCPGAGKSVFSRKLNEVVKIPFVHLDNLYWNNDRTTIPKEVFLQFLSETLDRDSWIIDGNYLSTMKLRLSKCDTVFFFDLPTDICLDGIRGRVGISRPDIPWTEQSVDPEFEDFVKNFSKETRPIIIEYLESFSHLNIITFKSRREAEDYIKKIKNEQC